MPRIADDRDEVKGLEEAKRLMSELAWAECRLAFLDAFTEKEVQTVREQYAGNRLIRAKLVADAAVRLRNFILRNKPLFKSPRKVVTDSGSFGLQTASEVVVEDEDKAVSALEKRGFKSCIKTTSTVVKSAVKKLLEDRRRIAHCRLKRGDTAVYKVAKARIEKAKERGGRA